MPSYAESDIDTAVSFVHLSVCLFITLWQHVKMAEIPSPSGSCIIYLSHNESLLFGQGH